MYLLEASAYLGRGELGYMELLRRRRSNRSHPRLVLVFSLGAYLDLPWLDLKEVVRLLLLLLRRWQKGLLLFIHG